MAWLSTNENAGSWNKTNWSQSQTGPEPIAKHVFDFVSASGAVLVSKLLIVADSATVLDSASIFISVACVDNGAASDSVSVSKPAVPVAVIGGTGGGGGGGRLMTTDILPENIVVEDMAHELTEDWAAEMVRDLREQQARQAREYEEALRNVQAITQRDRLERQAEDAARERRVQELYREQDRAYAAAQQMLLQQLDEERRRRTIAERRSAEQLHQWSVRIRRMADDDGDEHTVEDIRVAPRPAASATAGREEAPLTNLGSINPLPASSVRVLGRVALKKAAQMGVSWAINAATDAVFGKSSRPSRRLTGKSRRH